MGRFRGTPSSSLWEKLRFVCLMQQKDINTVNRRGLHQHATSQVVWNVSHHLHPIGGFLRSWGNFSRQHGLQLRRILWFYCARWVKRWNSRHICTTADSRGGNFRSQRWEAMAVILFGHGQGWPTCTARTYEVRSKTILFKFKLRVCGALWGSLKPASRKFCARPAQGFAQGKL